MSTTRNYLADVAERVAEEDAESSRRDDERDAEPGEEPPTPAANGTLRWGAVYDELLADKHPEESVDRYVERMAAAARTRRRKLGPDGPLAPSPRASDQVSAPSEYVSGASDADWGYADE